MSARLRVIDGPDKGAEYALTPGDPVLIGRGKQTATKLNDPQTSRIHCQVKLEGKQIVLTDLDSASGTFLNNQKVTTQPLKNGDVIQVGSTRLQLELGDPRDDSTLPPTAPAAKAASPHRMTAVDPASPAALPELPRERTKELSGKMLSYFQLGPVIATGASGLVFRAVNTRKDQPAAVKLLWSDFNRDEEAVQRFIRAMRTMLPIKHPHLVAIQEAGRVGPYCYVAMDLVEGESLHEVAERFGHDGMVDWRYGLRVAAHLSRALVYAHGNSILHRNITPRNILVSRKDQVARLGDLMAAKAMEGAMAQEITRPGEMFGDLRFIAPERTRAGGVEVDERSDIYGLGAAVYNVLTGHPPFEGDSFTELVLKIRKGHIDSPSRAQPGMPDEVEAVLMKMLATKPEDRFQTAGEMLGTLEKLAKAHRVAT